MIVRALIEFPLHGASYDLGENLRVVVCSVAEGAEKPKKYPVMLHKADIAPLNKADLAGASGVDRRELESNVREVNPKATVFAVSCGPGVGIDAWLAWLKHTSRSFRMSASSVARWPGSRFWFRGLSDRREAASRGFEPGA